MDLQATLEQQDPQAQLGLVVLLDKLELLDNKELQDFLD
jgi:hypothetical protein